MAENLSHFFKEFNDMADFFVENKEDQNQESIAEFRKGFNHLLLYYNVKPNFFI